MALGLAKVLCLWLPQNFKEVLDLPESQKGLGEEWKGLGNSGSLEQSKGPQQILNLKCAEF